MIGDPDLLKLILIKDFDHFVDRRPMQTQSKGVIENALALRTGTEWKTLRDIMSPAFTSGKMKGMFSLVCEKADTLVSFSLEEATKKGYTDMKKNCGCYALDAIASCAFGIECNSFVKEKAEFVKMVDSFFNRPTTWLLKNALLFTAPKVFNALRLSLDTHHIKFFETAVKEILAVREKGKKRGDFLDLMLEARDSNYDPNSNEEPGNNTLEKLYPNTVRLLTIITLWLVDNLFSAAPLSYFSTDGQGDSGSVYPLLDCWLWLTGFLAGFWIIPVS